MFASNSRQAEPTCRRLLPSFQCSIQRVAIASKDVPALVPYGHLRRHAPHHRVNTSSQQPPVRQHDARASANDCSG